MKRTVIVAICVVVVLVVGAGIGYGAWRYFKTSDSGLTTRTIGGGSGDAGAPGGASTISIYAPSELSKILERVTTAFQQEQPGTTFQFTLGPSKQLVARIKGGQKPSLYIDTRGAISQLPPDTKPTAVPITLGYDLVQLAVPKGNPKQVTGLDAFAAGSGLNTGICAPQLLCGRADARVFQSFGVSPAPSMVATNVGQLTGGLANGSLDAVLLLRTDLRGVLTRINTPQLPPNELRRIEYQMAPYRTGGSTQQFTDWVQGSPTARKILRYTGMLAFFDR